MEQITAMKIKGVTFTDFRNHKAPQSYTFGDISYITGHNGNMEILNFGGTVSLQEYMDLQRYTLGKLMFRMSGIRPAV